MKIVDKAISISSKLVVDNNQYQHFAFIFLRNKLLSIGQNDMENTSPKAIRFAKRFGAEKPLRFPFIHAEIDAISKLWGKRYIDSSLTLVSVRLNRFYEPRKSKPCKDCETVLKGLNLPFMYFDGVWK